MKRICTMSAVLLVCATVMPQTATAFDDRDKLTRVVNRPVTMGITSDRYARAEGLLRHNLQRLLLNASITPRWIGETDRLWYRRDTVSGHEFVIVDATTGARTPAFDHAAIADGLKALTGGPVNSSALPLFGAVWSPDSRHIILPRTDERLVGEYHFMELLPPDGIPRPRIHTKRVALVGDANQPRYESHLFDVTSGEGYRVPLPEGCSADIEAMASPAIWGDGGRQVYFICHTETNSVVTLYGLDVKSRDLRELVSERSDTYLEVIYLPENIDPGRSYPVVEHIYGGPQTNLTPTTFVDAAGVTFHGGQRPAFELTELGFILVMMDVRGTPLRSKEFHDYTYTSHHEFAIEDHVAVIRQLAERYPAIDLDRVGIYGHSWGGYASALAMLRFPDFYKVAVSSAGPYDYRFLYPVFAKWTGVPDGRRRAGDAIG
jgi:hypothetical protein